jgi:hypothetical protein
MELFCRRAFSVSGALNTLFLPRRGSESALNLNAVHKQCRQNREFPA